MYLYDVRESHSWEKLLSAWKSCVFVCTGKKIDWIAGPRIELPDRNYGPSRAFTQKYTCTDAELIIKAESCDVGNSRDGWGYTLNVQLKIKTPNGPIEMNASRSYYDTQLPQHRQFFTGALDDDLWHRLYTALDETFLQPT